MTESKGSKEDGNQNWFEHLALILDQNIKGVQIGIYTIALTGLAIALRSVRPFKKFVKPSDIPPSFIHKHVKLSGKVLQIDFNPKPFLLVDHKPLIGSSLRRRGSGLPVNIDSIDVSSNGVSWLQSVLVGHKIDFTLLAAQPKSVSCIVIHNKKNIGNSLVSLGFASTGTFNMDLENDVLYKEYYNSLLKDEAKAERNGAGMWWDRKPNTLIKLTQSVLSKMPILNRLW